MVCWYLLLFLLYINIETGKNRCLIVRKVAGKLLFTWLSLLMSLMVFLCCLCISHEISWLRSGTELVNFLKVFIPTFTLEQEADKRFKSKNGEL